MINEGDRSLETLKTRFFKYLEFCSANDVPLGNSQAYLAMGITRRDISDWYNGYRRGPEYQAFASFVKRVLAANRESLMIGGKLNPIIGIWWEKSHDGMSETEEADAMLNSDSLDDKRDAQQIAETYQNLLPE